MEQLLDLDEDELWRRHLQPDKHTNEMYAFIDQCLDNHLDWAAGDKEVFVLQFGLKRLGEGVRDIHFEIKLLKTIFAFFKKLCMGIPYVLPVDRIEATIQSLEQIVLVSGNFDAKMELEMKKAASQGQENVKSAESDDVGDRVRLDSLISQVKDIFPDFGDGFIENFGLSSETVIMKLLEGDLPPYLDKLDRKLELVKVSQATPPSSAQPQPAYSLSQRKNIFDGDELDVFTHGQIQTDKISSKQRSTGDEKVTSDLKARTLAQAKLIQEEEESYASLYEDEYDDSYDAFTGKMGNVSLLDLDVESSTEQLSAPEEKKVPVKKEDEATNILSKLFAEGNRSIFEVSSRKSDARAKLRKETGMTDEQIEGCASKYGRSRRSFNGKANKKIYQPPPPRKKKEAQQTAQTEEEAVGEGAEILAVGAMESISVATVTLGSIMLARANSYGTFIVQFSTRQNLKKPPKR
ncbi:hypothetical protein HDU96_007560 [Phlyctochytrium bullatum]|nr:hypothetical protein HDU96_007560 [Phlyctochytrium bullatum]